jgi:MFS transporter, OFA family, oxalate/formate antiporter
LRLPIWGLHVEIVASPIFWVMYVMFVLVGAGGLMATAQLAPIANDFGVAKVPVSLIGITLPALTFALSIDRILNGVTRQFFGWVSDNIGREKTMSWLSGSRRLASGR